MKALSKALVNQCNVSKAHLEVKNSYLLTIFPPLEDEVTRNYINV